MGPASPATAAPAQPQARTTLGQGTGTPYGDFNSPGVIAGLTNAYPNFNMQQLGSVNNAYKQQYGTNITPDALMRAMSETQGNYLWGPPTGGRVAPPGATVASPTASIVSPNGTYQGGAFTPNAAGTAAGVQPVAANSAVTAPLMSNNPVAPTAGPTSPTAYAANPTAPTMPPPPTDLKGSMANTTNLINQTGGGTNLQNGGGLAQLSQLLGGMGGGAGGSATGGASSGGSGAGAPSGSDALLKQIQDQLGKIQNPYDLLQQREQALGIPAAQQQVSGLRSAITNTTNLLNKIAPSVEGRTANSLVTSAQANRMIQNESAPVQQQLSTLGTQEQNAQSALSNLMSQANSEATMQSTGQQDVLKNLSSLQGMMASSEAAKQTQANFVSQQAQAKEQFEMNLALDVQKFNLSKDQAAEARRQFDAQQAFEQQKFTEADAQAQWDNRFKQQQLGITQQQANQTGLLDQARAQLATMQSQLDLAKAQAAGGGKSVYSNLFNNNSTASVPTPSTPDFLSGLLGFTGNNAAALGGK